MKCKCAVWILAALATTFSGSILAQNDSSKTAPSISQTHTDEHEKSVERKISGPYRLTYTLTEMDGAKGINSQKYEAVMDANAQPTRINIDSIVSVIYGSSSLYTKEHVSVRIFASLSQLPNGLELTTDLRQTGFASGMENEQTGGQKQPVVRVSDFSTSALLSENKRLLIGQLDIPGSTHVLQIQVELTKVP